MGVSVLILLSVLLRATVCASQKCDLQSMQDMVIDVSAAVARGARFSDPVHASGVEECVNTCCTQLFGSGLRPCNLAIYDSRKINSQQNCYLFHCPKVDSCPMSALPGVLSYRLWIASDPDPTEVKPQQPLMFSEQTKTRSSTGKKSKPALHPPGSEQKESDETPSPHDLTENKLTSAPSQSAEGEVEHRANIDESDTPGRITTQLLHLAENIDKHLEKIESKSQAAKVSNNPIQVLHLSSNAAEPAVETTITSTHGETKRIPSDTKRPKATVKEKKTETIEVHYPTQASKTPGVIPGRTSHMPSTVAPQAVPGTKANLIAPTTTSQDVGDAQKVPSSDVTGIGADSDNTTARTIAEDLKIGHANTHTDIPTPDMVHQTQPPPAVTRPSSLRTSVSKDTKPILKNEVRPSTKGKEPEGTLPEPNSLAEQDPSPPLVHLEKVPRKIDNMGALPGDNPPTDDRNGLVAALVFGVVFLLVVIGLVSRKVAEARQRHQYTKLDYLINGMYVDT
ncbi:MANSC domain-containing protein 1 [Mixophyes fleayi]|uniref:MANSC domain-containing protein 1 n=1 Tax=Mixophyes fleayi TaxID=3061075 RepID=UPI003F4E266A